MTTHEAAVRVAVAKLEAIGATVKRLGTLTYSLRRHGEPMVVMAEDVESMIAALNTARDLYIGVKPEVEP